MLSKLKEIFRKDATSTLGIGGVQYHDHQSHHINSGGDDRDNSHHPSSCCSTSGDGAHKEHIVRHNGAKEHSGDDIKVLEGSHTEYHNRCEGHSAKVSQNFERRERRHTDNHNHGRGHSSCCSHDNHTETEHNHSGHSHNNGHSCHFMGSAQDYLRKFFKVGVFTLLLTLLTDRGIKVLPAVLQNLLSFSALSWTVGDILSLVLIGLIFKEALIFVEHAKHEIKAKKPGMMTLVSIAVVAGFAFSILHYLFPSVFGANFTLEIATLVWVLMLGHYIEAKADINSRIALEELLKLLPKKVHKVVELEQNITEEVDVSALLKGDMVLVKAGENIPADGKVIKGTASVSNAHITGESLPISVTVGDTVVAGASVLDGMLYIKITAAGKDSTIGRLTTLLETALSTAPSMQRLADKVAFYLTFVSLGVAILTFIVWWFILGKSLAFALTMAISVLVITCPHALGLAIPAVIAIATNKGAKLGAFIKNLGVFEFLPKVKWIVLDKTGTLTEGKLSVDRAYTLADLPDEEVAHIVYELERSNVHPIAEALVRHVEGKTMPGGASVRLVKDSIRVVPGKGVMCELDGHTHKKVYLGSINWAKERLSKQDSLEKVIKTVKKAPNQTMALLFTDDKVLAAFLLSDTIRKSAYKLVEDAHRMGINVAILTGDNKETANYVADKLGIDRIFAEVSPEDKYKFIKRLQRYTQDGAVMMVGDGINDAAALIQADIGVAVRSGTDIAVNSADIVLMNSDPYSIIRLIKLGRLTFSKMIQNIFWALGYNIFAIPAAAGAFRPWGVAISPEVAAIIMSLSTVIVVLNALSLRLRQV